MKITKYVLIIMGVFCSSLIYAQAPANDKFENAIPICPDIEYVGTNKLATVDSLENETPAFYNACFDTIANMVWYKFKTNYEGGHVSIKFTNISCLTGVQKNDSLEATIVDMNYKSPKPFVVGDCTVGSSADDMVVNTALPLEPLKEYYLVIDGLHHYDSKETAECDFTIELFGEGAGVRVKTIPEGASRSLILGERVLITAQGAANAKGLVAWTPNDPDIIEDFNTKSTYVFPQDETTTYRVRTENRFDSIPLVCILKDSIVFYVNEQLTPYNTFTPNGDGINDLWEIPRIDNIEEFQNADVTIYNRWGQVVFQEIGYKNKEGWDGTFNGEPLPEATYYWVINLLDFFNNDRKYTGSVTIIR